MSVPTASKIAAERAPVRRPGIALFLRRPRAGPGLPEKHEAEKDQPRRQLSRFLDKHRRESGIVYCSSRDRTEKLAAMNTIAANRAGMASNE